jgi:hypothetical protein
MMDGRAPLAEAPLARRREGELISFYENNVHSGSGELRFYLPKLLAILF